MHKLLKVLTMAGLLLALPAATMACNGKACNISCASDAKHQAHGKHHAIPGKSPAYIRKIVKSADKLGLSDKQRKQVGELLVQAESAAAEVHAKAEIAVAEFRGKLHSGEATDRDMRAYARLMGELHSAKLEANLKASMAAAKLLNTEQKQKLYTHKNGNKHP